MVQAPASVSAGSRLRPPSLAGWSWRRLLFLGFCGGLAFAVTQRLLSLQLEVPWRNTQPFGVQAIPGTSLDSLRRRHGAEGQAIRADLDQIQLEQQQRRQQAEDQQRLDRLEAEDRERRERERRDFEQGGRLQEPPFPADSPAPPVPEPRLELPPEPSTPPAPAPAPPP